MALTTPTPARQSTVATGTATGATTDAAPNASAAPNVDPNAVFTGLIDALNANQKQLVLAGQQKYADVYEIKFSSEALMNAKLKKPGTVDQSQTNMQNPNNSKKLDPETNKVNNNSQTIQITAGKPIVQIIDEIMRQSEYVYGQQVATVDPNTGKTTPNPNVGTETKWYKISVQSVPIGNDIDTKRNLFPQKITYMISPYALASVPSEYFPPGKFRGLHKSYNYWFTGQNTQILEYEQTYNFLYNLTISTQTGIPDDNRFFTTDSRELYSRTFATRSGQNDMGSSSNEPGANLADGLFTISDFIGIGIRIVGDPAWLQQGPEVAGGNLGEMSASGFNPDGTINFDAGQVLFDVSWNRPVDYDFETGIAPVTARNVSSAGGGLTLPKENQTYLARTIKSIFRRGRFEQELLGTLYLEEPSGKIANANSASAPGVVPASPGEAAAAGAVTNFNSQQGVIDLSNSKNRTRTPTVTEGGMTTDAPNKTSPPNPATSSPSNTNQNTPALPVKPPANPTSSGGINTSPGTTLPPVLGQLTLNNGRVATFYDTTDPTVAYNATSYQQSLSKGATPIAPQLIKKDDA